MQRSSVILSLAILILVVILTPMAGDYLARREFLAQAGEASQLFIAIQSAPLDRKVTGQGIAYPAESKISSTAAYLDRLRQEGYWRGNDRMILHHFVIANVSENDPPDTVLILSRNAYQDLRAGHAPRNFIVFLKSGDGASFKVGVNSFFKLPPRQPAFLAP
jgi:hypothetical protein